MARILVVDDEEGIRELVAEVLEGEGHEVVRASDGEQALRALDAGAFAALVTDMRMPGIDGLELVRRARAALPDLEILVLTAHGTIETAVEAIKLGAREYLQKPLRSPAELRLVMARALEHRALALGRERERVLDQDGLPDLSYGDPAMRPVLDAIAKVAPTAANVLLLGESGSGKTLFARAIHARSRVASGPFVALNCAALPAQLLESELFGHEKGAYTGAHAQRRGRIELAEGGTFFLDEIGELSPELQAKLLRVVEERAFERVGGSRSLRADVRWIAATHHDLRSAIAAGRFREDLYHRLAVFPVRIPALRERPRDVIPLAEALLVSVVRELGRPPLELGASAKAAIVEHPWPGNVRELRNALERGAIVTGQSVLEAEALGIERRSGPPHPLTNAPALASKKLEAIEHEAIERALTQHDGNRKRAAEQLGIGLRTLYDKLRRHGLGEGP